MIKKTFFKRICIMLVTLSCVAGLTGCNKEEYQTVGENKVKVTTLSKQWEVIEGPKKGAAGTYTKGSKQDMDGDKIKETVYYAIDVENGYATYTVYKSSKKKKWVYNAS